MGFTYIDVLRSVTLLMLEIFVIWGMMFIVKLWIDRYNIMNRETTEHIDLSIRFTSLSSSSVSDEYDYARVILQDSPYETKVVYSSKEHNDKAKDLPKSKFHHTIAYKVEDDQNFTLILNK